MSNQQTIADFRKGDVVNIEAVVTHAGGGQIRVEAKDGVTIILAAANATLAYHRYEVGDRVRFGGEIGIVRCQHIDLVWIEREKKTDYRPDLTTENARDLEPAPAPVEAAEG